MVDRKHIISLQGREFVTYEGLLDAAHRAGLAQITTSLIQIPCAENGQTAIVRATVTLRDRDTGISREFDGIGDANPGNVNRNIASHLIRMSETRAKARALRDATNIGMTAWDEVESASDFASPPTRSADQQQASTAKTEAPPLPNRRYEAPPNPITDAHLPDDKRFHPGGCSYAQTKAIAALMAKKGWDDNQGRQFLLDRFKKQSRKQLTSGEASHMIEHLDALQDAAKEPQPSV